MAVLATSTSMTDKRTKEKLEQIPYIRYSVIFKDQTEALLDLESEVNAMSQAFAYQLGLKIQKTNVGAQKIDGTTLKIYGIVVSIFSSQIRMVKRSFLNTASYRLMLCRI